MVSEKTENLLLKTAWSPGGGGIRVFRYSVVSYGVNHEFQPYNNIIINIIIEIFFMYSMRFRFTEYMNT